MAKDEGLPVRGWSFITCGGGGGRPFCWGVIFKILIVFGGSFSDIKGALLGGSLNYHMLSS